MLGRRPYRGCSTNSEYWSEVGFMCVLAANETHHGAAGIDVDFKIRWPPQFLCMQWFASLSRVYRIERWKIVIASKHFPAQPFDLECTSPVVIRSQAMRYLSDGIN